MKGLDFAAMTDAEIISCWRHQHQRTGYTTVDIASAQSGLPAKSTTNRIFGKQSREVASTVLKHLRLMCVLGWRVVDRYELDNLIRENQQLRERVEFLEQRWRDKFTPRSDRRSA